MAMAEATTPATTSAPSARRSFGTVITFLPRVPRVFVRVVTVLSLPSALRSILHGEIQSSRAHPGRGPAPCAGEIDIPRAVEPVVTHPTRRFELMSHGVVERPRADPVEVVVALVEGRALGLTLLPDLIGGI